MKRIISTAIAAVLIAGAGLSVPAAATAAVPSNVVTSKEFDKVTQGNPISYVRSVFGTQGVVVDRSNPPGTRDDYVRVEFPTYYEDGIVQVEFLRRTSGTWYLVTKYAFWGKQARRTSNKATESEFFKVKQGSSIAFARSTFGTTGTIAERYDAPGTDHDSVVVEWPTASTTGWVQVLFKKRSGSWKVSTRAAYWDVAPKRTANKATESEFKQVKPGNSIDHARRTFGTQGTINYYFDAPGTPDDAVWLLWPTRSTDGFVEADFVKRTTGTWKVDGRWAYWARAATPTTDLATQEELDSLKVRLGNGYVPLAEVRSTFGSQGTIVYYADDRGTESDLLEVEWYAGTEAGNVTALLRRNSTPGWSVVDAEELWGPWAESAAPQARMTSENQEPPAMTPGEAQAAARPLWDLHRAD